MTRGASIGDRYYATYIVNIDGTGLTLIDSTEEVNIHSPIFSPDGQQIFYLAIAEPTDTIIRTPYYPVYKIDIDGNNNQVFMRDVASLPLWSPQGDKIAYVAFVEDEYQLFVANADGTNPQQLTFETTVQGGVAASCWTPDGEKIVYIVESSFKTTIWIMNADGSEKMRLTDPNFTNRDPAITLDGKYILFNSNQPDMYGICVMKLDGSEQKLLIKDGYCPVPCKDMNK